MSVSVMASNSIFCSQKFEANFLDNNHLMFSNCSHGAREMAHAHDRS